MTKKLAFLIVIGVFAFYYILGEIINTDIIDAFHYSKDGFSISFIGIILWVATSLLIGYLIELINKK